MRLSLLTFLLAATAGCGGDPRIGFIGLWNMNFTSVVTVSGQASTNSEMQTLELRSMMGSNAITFGTSACTFTATATNGTTLTIAPAMCRRQMSGSCEQIDMTFAESSGTLNGMTLSITANGTLTATCGGTMTTGTVRYSWTGTMMP